MKEKYRVFLSDTPRFPRNSSEYACLESHVIEIVAPFILLHLALYSVKKTFKDNLLWGEASPRRRTSLDLLLIDAYANKLREY